ncbi:MAG: hypothetical protein ACXABO_19890 [Promethearchaeota archaeon]
MGIVVLLVGLVLTIIEVSAVGVGLISIRIGLLIFGLYPLMSYRGIQEEFKDVIEKK